MKGRNKMGTIQDAMIKAGVVSEDYRKYLEQEDKRKEKLVDKERRRLAHKLEIEQKRTERAEK
jgi:hypothetical protein